MTEPHKPKPAPTPSNAPVVETKKDDPSQRSTNPQQSAPTNNAQSTKSVEGVAKPVTEPDAAAAAKAAENANRKIGEAQEELAQAKADMSNVTGLYARLADESDVKPGFDGFLLLDKDGMPIRFQAEMPEDGTPVCRARRATHSDRGMSQIVSPAGAELVPPLQPNSDLRYKPPEPGEEREGQDKSFLEGRENQRAQAKGPHPDAKEPRPGQK